MITSMLELRWKKRVFIIAGSDQISIDQQKRDLLSHASQLDDRDLVVIAIEAGSVRTVHGGAAIDDRASTLTDRFSIRDEDGYIALLVGKDGLEKWRSRAPTGWPMIAEIIDAMPMRQTEMRQP